MKTQSKTRGAVIVTRVSTGEQAKHGTSPETQLAACRAKALSMNLPIVGEFYDPGISGAFFLLREGMQAALAAIQEGRADTLINPSMSRYSRDVEHQQAIKKAVRAAGGRVVFCDMDFDDTPEGDLNFTIQGGFAAYEREVIRARSMKGKRARAEAGIQSARTLSPYGYRIPTKADIIRGDYPPDQLGKYIIIESEAAIVRRIFECYAAGTHSYYALAREFNQEAVPTARGGVHWHAATFKNIVANPCYKGSPAFGRWKHSMDETRLQEINPATGRPYVSVRTAEAKPESEWIHLTAPAIVSEEVWERAQERSAGNRARLGGNPTKIRMLSGRVRCPVCGGSMQRCQQPHGRATDFVCGRYKSAMHSAAPEKPCVRTRYQVPIVEQAVITSIADACENPEVISAQIAEYSQKPGMEKQAGIARLELTAVMTALEDVATEEKMAVKAQIAGLMVGAPASAYEAVFAELAEKRKGLEVKRDYLAKQAQTQDRADEPEALKTPERIKTEAIENLHRVLTSDLTTGVEKRDLLALIVDGVYPRKDGAEVRFLPGVFRETIKGITILTPTSEASASVSSLLPPPSIKMVRPPGVWIRVLSPCPTSIAVTRSFPASGSGRRASAHQSREPSGSSGAKRKRRRRESFDGASSVGASGAGVSASGVPSSVGMGSSMNPPASFYLLDSADKRRD